MSEKISDIKLVFEQAKIDEYPELYKKYESDSRAGVKNLIRKYQKQEEKLEQERARLEQMREYEKTRWVGDIKKEKATHRLLLGVARRLPPQLNC